MVGIRSFPFGSKGLFSGGEPAVGFREWTLFENQGGGVSGDS